MNLDSLLLLSEVEGFVAEQSVDRFIDEEVNMAKAMQNRLEETLIKALKTVLKKLCYFQTQNSLVEISSDLLLAHYFLRGLITESTFLSSHPSFLVKAPCTCKNYKYNIHFSVVLCQSQLETLRR